MEPKYVLNFLRDWESKPDHRDIHEYRLVCSGQMFTGDHHWRNFGARVLLEKPVSLVVAISELADPAKSYPQEWVLTLGTMPDSEGDRSFEIVHDLAAILSLLCRRLITVAGRTFVRGAYVHEGKKVGERWVPVPLATQVQYDHWPYQPVRQVDHPSEPNQNHYEPLVTTFPVARATRVLTALPHLEHAERIVLAARMYWAGMRELYNRTDIAYLLMTMSVEALANQAVRSYDKDDNAVRNVPGHIMALCKKVGSTDEEAVKDAWANIARPGPTYAFPRFMTDNVTDELWDRPDDLFHTARVFLSMMPQPKADFSKIMADVYQQRCQFVHYGKPYPAAIELGRSEYLSSDASMAMWKGVKFPPFVWFERAVHLALVNYIEKEIAKIPAKPSAASAIPQSQPARPVT